MIEIEAEPGLCPPARAALRAAGIEEGHLAIMLVDSAHIHELNREHRGIDRPTDVLSFPVDETGPAAGPRELGDVVICPEHTEDVEEAVVHGVLHLCGYDHETDGGEMLALQDQIVETLRCSSDQRSDCAPPQGRLRCSSDQRSDCAPPQGRLR